MGIWANRKQQKDAENKQFYQIMSVFRSITMTDADKVAFQGHKHSFTYAFDLLLNDTEIPLIYTTAAREKENSKNPNKDTKGGILILTDHRLLFAYRDQNYNQFKEIIVLDDIQEINYAAGLLDFNALTLKKGKTMYKYTNITKSFRGHELISLLKKTINEREFKSKQK